MPQVLMELMRHASIATTLKYYVGRNADTTAAALYAAVANLPPSDLPKCLCDQRLLVFGRYLYTRIVWRI